MIQLPPPLPFPGPDTAVRPHRADRVAMHEERPPVAPKPFGGKPWWQPDAASLLSIYAVLLLLVPARLVFGPLGGIGKPSLLFGLGLLALWLASRVVPYVTTRGSNPMRRVLLLFGVVSLASYGLGYGRGLPGDEAASADRTLLATLSLLGVALMTADAIRTRDRLDRVLKTLLVAGTVCSVIGIIQFTTGVDLANMIKIPGMRYNGILYGFGERGGPGFRRVAGTANHAIEFAVVLAMLLPVAVHYALHAAERRERILRGAQVAVLVLGIAFAISRSGVLAMAAVVIVMGICWAPGIKAKALLVIGAGLVALRVAVPGLIGTFRNLFLDAESDPSITGRTNDYEYVFNLIDQRPWFGRGLGTFVPTDYIILDNQLLGSLVATGYVGLCTLLLLYFVGFSVARRVARRGGTDNSRHLAQALMATVAAGLIVTITFDALSFAQYSGVLFITFGAIGALWRLERLGDSGEDVPRDKPLLKGWRSVQHPAPHPLGRALPDLSDHLGWRRKRPV